MTKTRTDEFMLIWFNSIQKWRVITPHEMVAGLYPSHGHALQAALGYINAAEAEFTCVQNDGELLHFEHKDIAVEICDNCFYVHGIDQPCPVCEAKK